MAVVDSDHLTDAEKLELIDRLWESLEGPHALLTAAQREELDRRLDADDRGDQETIAWDEMMARLRRSRS